MKTELFLLLLFIFLIVIGIMGLFFYAQSDKPKRKKTGKIILKITAVLLLINSFLLTNGSGRKENYSVSSCQDFWSLHQLPQIDSTMSLIDYSSKRDFIFPGQRTALSIIVKLFVTIYLTFIQLRMIFPIAKRINS